MLDMIPVAPAAAGLEVRPLFPLLLPRSCKRLAQRAKAFPGRDENGFNVLATWWARGPDHNGLQGFAIYLKWLPCKL